MGKNRRGKNIKKIANWKGTCPICRRTAVKLLWNKVTANGTINVCKHCGNK
jgi:transcription elongation factor Elf1